MNELDLNIGTQIYCADEKYGKLAKVAVDLGVWQVTHLIVEEGLLLKRSRVFPIHSVERATADGLHLAIDPDELTDYPEYREEVIEMVAPGQVEGIRPTSPLAYGGPTYTPKVPQKVRYGVPDHIAVLEMGMPIIGLGGRIGKLDHFLVKAGNGRITHLVTQQGLLFTTRRVIPIAIVEQITEKGVSIAATEEELKGFPQYEPQETARPQKVSNDNPGQPGAKNGSELALSTRIALALLEDSRTSDAVIEVIDQRGLITLQGEVADVQTRQTAETIAAEQSGVISVVNELQVKH